MAFEIKFQNFDYSEVVVPQPKEEGGTALKKLRNEGIFHLMRCARCGSISKDSHQFICGSGHVVCRSCIATVSLCPYGTAAEGGECGSVLSLLRVPVAYEQLTGLFKVEEEGIQSLDPAAIPESSQNKKQAVLQDDKKEEPVNTLKEEGAAAEVSVQEEDKKGKVPEIKIGQKDKKKEMKIAQEENKKEVKINEKKIPMPEAEILEKKEEDKKQPEVNLMDEDKKDTVKILQQKGKKSSDASLEKKKEDKKQLPEDKKKDTEVKILQKKGKKQSSEVKVLHETVEKPEVKEDEKKDADVKPLKEDKKNEAEVKTLQDEQEDKKQEMATEGGAATEEDLDLDLGAVGVATATSSASAEETKAMNDLLLKMKDESNKKLIRDIIQKKLRAANSPKPVVEVTPKTDHAQSE